MSMYTKRWPTNPPPGHGADGEPPAEPPDGEPEDFTQRRATARAAASRRGRGLPPHPESLRYSPVMWITVITLAILVLSGLIVWRGMTHPPPAPMATPAGVSDDGGKQAGITVAGTGPTTVEIYTDLVCAACRTVDAQIRPYVDQLVAQNRIRLVWHPLGALDGHTTPAGYSSRAANALACAADTGRLRQYAEVLFANQPAPGGPGLSDDTLIDVAGPVGLIMPAFAACVRDQRYHDWVEVGTAMAAQRGATDLPAIFVNGTRLARTTPQALLSAVG